MSDLREFNFGILQGRYKYEVADQLNELSKFIQSYRKNGESLEGLKNRIRDVIEKIYVKHRFENIVLVTHTNVIKALISIFSKYNIGIVQENYHVKNTCLVVINVTSKGHGKIEKMEDVVVDKF